MAIREHLRQILRFFVSYLHGFSGPQGQKWGFFGENKERRGAILTPNELVFTFGSLHLCVQFGENLQRNATVRVMTHGQTQTDFIICPMLYAIAMGQMIIIIQKFIMRT